MITVSSVVNASEIQLLCITYELFLNDINNAMQLEGDARQAAIHHAKEVLYVLGDNLNLEVPIAKDLLKLYMYVQKILVENTSDDECLKESYKLVEAVYKGYKELEKNEKNQRPTMKNTQNIYAGMTYTKGTLDEVVDEYTNRGFQV
ncbi:MAG: flagellar protein FliS [Cellulosilyticaceae bacterium]